MTKVNQPLSRQTDKHQAYIEVYCDGGARGNPGPAGIGFVVKKSSGQVIHSSKKYIGRATNNVAEYQAAIHALKWISQNFHLFSPSPNRVKFFLDSVLVANQLSGKFKVKSNHLRDLFATADALIGRLKTKVSFTSIPREQNNQADSLVNQALDENTSS